MRYTYTVLFFALCVVVVSVPASFTQNFQDGTGYTTCTGVTCSYTQNLTGGNSYFFSNAFYSGMTINTNPEQTTYAAIRAIDDMSPYFHVYDSSMHEIASCGYGGPVFVHDDRVEVVVTGSTLTFYANGRIPYGYCNPQTIAVNPSYVGFSGGHYDDYTYGTTAQRVVYGMPQQDVFVIKKDMINPAASGVAFKSNGTIVSSTFLTTTWSRSAVGVTGGTNESIVLANVGSGTVYATKYTRSKNTSTEYWDIATALVNSGAPYGAYETYIPNETGVHSIAIDYIGSGASVSFDKKTYSQGDTAIITHAIADGGYWNTGLYNYKLVIMNGNTGQFIHNESITTQSSTSTYTFTSSDTQGTYYAVVMADVLSSGQEIWMNYDYAAVNAYFTMTGYVLDAQNATEISGANVSIVQGSIISNTITPTFGNYSATGFLTGAALTVNATATGHKQYLASFTPMTAGTKYINITLNGTSPSFTGMGIGGVARDGIFTGTTITSGYGRPITGATVFVKNTSTGEYYTTTTNNAGWYLCDFGANCTLTNVRPYSVWGEKLGYSNSPNYTAVTG